VQISTERLRLPAERWAPFWAAFAHAVRNAVDHGVEQPEAREAAGKPRVGTLRMSTAVQGEELVVAIEDDGAGVPWELVRAKAAARGLPHTTRDELVEALFADRLSTRDHVTTLSGRGVGLGAVREAIRKLGGRVEVDSLPGRGARFAFITTVQQAGLELSTLESQAKAA
jgi:two-component system chemotaxis sensor kinase CheA